MKAIRVLRQFKWAEKPLTRYDGKIKQLSQKKPKRKLQPPVPK